MICLRGTGEELAHADGAGCHAECTEHILIFLWRVLVPADFVHAPRGAINGGTGRTLEPGLEPVGGTILCVKGVCGYLSSLVCQPNCGTNRPTDSRNTLNPDVDNTLYRRIQRFACYLYLALAALSFLPVSSTGNYPREDV